MARAVENVAQMSISGQSAGTSGHIVIGTAGHVDHGKSTLVRALTGIDPDRLIEEKTRQMTIDLGFAWIELPSGRRAGIVDVPGHERFIKNMLAGVGGIDMALLVIAADEGPMPQTREHLAILDLLGVTQGIVVLTKSDTVDDEMIELVREEAIELVKLTGLAGSQVVAVSAVTGKGFESLIAEIDASIGAARNAHQSGPPRMPVDRVFTVQGFGTVVTGTVIGGRLQVGQDVVLMPDGRASRIRGIQSHSRKVERVESGERAAINLAGVATDDVRRGDVLTVPGALTASVRIDCFVSMLSSSPIPLCQNDPVDLFCGAAEVQAWPTLLDKECIEPGSQGWVQFRLGSPLAVAKGERCIIRRASPSETIGGGTVVDPKPTRHKRFRPDVVAALEVRLSGTPEALLLDALRVDPVEWQALMGNPPAGLDAAQAEAALASLVQSGAVVRLDPVGRALSPQSFVVAADRWQSIAESIRQRLEAYHDANPLRRGFQREELRSRMKVAPRAFDAVIGKAAAEGVLVDDGAAIRLPNFAITLDASQRERADAYLAAIAAQPMMTPPPGEFGIDDDLLAGLADLGEVVRVADGIVYAPDAYQAMIDGAMSYLDQHGSLTLATFRDLFGTSRKYAQAVLEDFDQRRLTRRVGDERRRFAGAAPIREEESRDSVSQ